MHVRLAVAGLMSLVASGVQAEGYETFNQSSFARAAALPALGQGAVLPAGASESRAALEWTNEYISDSNSREALTLDAETERIGLRYRRGFGGRWEWSAELPLVIAGGGMLDSVIEDWHRTFGLPNGGREFAPRDRYLIRYVRDGVTVLDRAHSDSNLGDARFGLGYALTDRWSLRAMAQLPTGDRNTLSGGHTGLALWTDYTLPLTASGRARLSLSGGASVASTAGPLSGLQVPVVGLAGAALTVPIWGALDGVLQFNGHTRLYQDSGMTPLSSASIQALFGVRYAASFGVIEAGVQEDAIVDASPDFSIHLAWTLRPGSP